jgi:hypothetical protein
LLEIYDAHGQRFLDTSATGDWLARLTDRYLLDTMSPLVVNGDTVTWTERLTPRSIPFPHALASSITIEVSAVVLNGSISSINGPYPMLSLHGLGAADRAPTGAGEPVTIAMPAPTTLLAASAIVLALAALVITRGVPSLYATLQRFARPPIA